MTGLGETIRKRREAAGLTHEGLGSLLGVAPDVVDQWEWDEAIPSSHLSARLGKVLGIHDRILIAPEVVIDLIPAGRVDGSSRVILTRPFPPRPTLAPPLPQTPQKPAFAPPPGRPQIPPPPAQPAPRRVQPIAGYVFAVFAIGVAFVAGALLGRISGDDSTPAGRIAALEIDKAALRLQDQALQAQVSLLVEQVGAFEAKAVAQGRRADDAEARVRAADALEADNEALAEKNRALVEENELLRSAIVVSSATGAVDRVALTIDDGGTAAASGEVLDTLAAKGVTATFFPSGENVQAFPAVWRRAVAEGHELGNHTLAHVGVTEVGTAGLLEQLEGWQRAVEKALGAEHVTRWFRPPFMSGFTDGEGPDGVRGVLAASGMITALWDVETFNALFTDAGPRLAGPDPTPQEVADYVVGRAREGSIILLHFGPKDVAALPLIIDGLREAGLEPVTLTDLLESLSSEDAAA